MGAALDRSPLAKSRIEDDAFIVAQVKGCLILCVESKSRIRKLSDI
jgi:hypothetical protein